VTHLTESHPVVEDVLGTWRTALGGDYTAYRGHVYRVLTFTRALAAAATAAPIADRTLHMLAVAVVFHDLGIWSDGTLDYLPPSEARARAHCAATGRSADAPTVAAMIAQHHKLLPYRGSDAALVEALRRADLVDLTFGTVRFGLPGELVRGARRAFPNAGFHLTLCRVIGGWCVRHPLRPLPMMKL
jgi:hypothetical protein